MNPNEFGADRQIYFVARINFLIYPILFPRCAVYSGACGHATPSPSRARTCTCCSTRPPTPSPASPSSTAPTTTPEDCYSCCSILANLLLQGNDSIGTDMTKYYNHEEMPQLIWLNDRTTASEGFWWKGYIQIHSYWIWSFCCAVCIILLGIILICPLCTSTCTLSRSNVYWYEKMNILSLPRQDIT